MVIYSCVSCWLVGAHFPKGSYRAFICLAHVALPCYLVAARVLEGLFGLAAVVAKAGAADHAECQTECPPDEVKSRRYI